MNAPKIRLFLWSIALGLGACGANGTQPMTQEQQAIAVAEAYVKSNFPDFDKTGKQITLQSAPEHWVVTYDLPPHMLGGAPVVWVERKTMKVIRSYRTQ